MKQIAYLSFLFSLSIYSCSHDTSKKKIIDFAFMNTSNKKVFSNKIVVISEQNCSDCIKTKLLSLKSKVNSNEQIIGQIFRISKGRNNSLESLKKETNDFIKWQDFEDIDILNALAELTGKKSGPYFIELSKNKLKSVEELN